MSRTRRCRMDRLARWAMGGALGILGIAFAGLLLSVVMRGLPHLRPSMLLADGQGGGIAHALVGSLCLGAGASVLALLLALPAAVALQRAYAPPRIAEAAALVLDLLWGTPSIVYGAFAFLLMVWMGVRTSLLAGILTLALVMVPVMTRAMTEAFRSLPPELWEQATALGATRGEITLKVALRQTLPGLVTAFLLAFGRGIGDAASILFTAGYTDRLPGSLMDPVASLPLEVFYQLATPDPTVQSRAHAAALLLLILVLGVTLISRALARRASRHRL